jgi:type I restriction enzyme M protein
MNDKKIGKMEKMYSNKLFCPLRGELNVEKIAKDGFNFTEEYQRIECIKFLLEKGYKKEYFDLEKNIIKVGRGGKNKVRADIVVYNQPKQNLKGKELNHLLDYVEIIAEIKRNNEEKRDAIDYQLKPAMKQVGKDCLGIYWDNVEQIFLIKEGGKIKEKEFDISKFPYFGANYKDKILKYKDIENHTIENFIKLLDQINQRLHNSGLSKDKRYSELFKLFLCKFYDEKMKKGTDKELDFQVYDNETNKSQSFIERISNLYGTNQRGARQYYSVNLPVKFSENLELKWEIIFDIVKLLQGKNILGTSPSVLQDFFIKFAPNILKIDLSQYYTPVNVIEAIVKICNIKRDDLIIDPAGGTGDFLTIALQEGKNKGYEDIKNNIYYWDSSDEAGKVAVLNMIFNGDGRANIKILDSIEEYNNSNGKFSLVLSNPPFGVKTIWEGKLEVMNNYNLGVKWKVKEGKENLHWEKVEKEKDKNKNDILVKQQLGILFIERCLNLLEKGGRLGIILPNGYLSKPSFKYVRKYLIENCKIIGVVGLPEGTFKKSGASVTPLILFVEKTKPDKLNYNIFFDSAKKIGFDFSKDTAPVIYTRDEETGNFIFKENRRVLDSDFPQIIKKFKCFAKNNNLNNWIEDNEKIENIDYTIASIKEILDDPNLILDSNRYSKEYFEAVKEIQKGSYKTLEEIIECREEEFDPHKEEYKSNNFYYIEIGDIDIGTGIINYKQEKGWKIAGKKQFKAYKGDILLSRVRTYRKGIGIITSDKSNILASKGGFIIIKNTKFISKENLYYFLRSDLFIKQAKAISSGSGYPTLNEEYFNKIYIPLDFKLSKEEKLKSKQEFENQLNILKELD